MSSLLAIFFGTIIYLLVLLDIIKTTVSVQGGGWLTNVISNNLWKVSLKFSGSNPKSKLLDRTGYLLLILMVALWILLLWVSLLILLLSDPNSIIKSTVSIPADNWEKFYYAGFVLSTVGVGDFTASNNLWRIISDIYSFTGLVFVTMSITYFLSVLNAVINQRRLALCLNSLGANPYDIVEKGWNGKNFNRLVNQASQFSNDIFKHSQNHLAYPVIHYFHSTEKETSIVIQIYKLYEALLILRYGVKENLQPHPQELESLFNAFENYVQIVKRLSNTRNKGIRLAEINIGHLKNFSFVKESRMELPKKLQKNREVLFNLVTNDGWSGL